jgi:thiol-disulfide isomerase/thioredoxin
MNTIFQNQKFIKIVRMVRPWITFGVVFAVLYYTGALSGLSAYSGSALMKTGIMNIDVEESRHKEAFDYNFTIKDANGTRVDFNQFKGKTVFLNLWATWCGPCVAEMPSIESLYGKVDKEKVVFVILDWFEDPGKVAKFVKQKKFTFPVYMVDGDVPPQLNVPSIPTTFVIGPDGNIATKKTGTANYDTETFKEYLEKL